jgi:ribonuclease D
MPQENLITPDTVRRVCWEPPKVLTPDAVETALAGHGARRWQIQQVGPLLLRALDTSA